MGPLRKQFITISLVALGLAFSFWGFIIAGLILMYNKYIWISLLSLMLGVICRVITLRLARRLVGLIPYLHTEDLLRQVSVLSPNTNTVTDSNGEIVGIVEENKEDVISTTYKTSEEEEGKKGYKLGE